jgi:S1-C subfamily serine protease
MKTTTVFSTGSFCFLFFCLSPFITNAQQNESPYFQQQQIIIQQNGNNRESFSIEMNGDQVFINGVPADQYKDSNIMIKGIKPYPSKRTKTFDTDEGFGVEWGDRNKSALGMKLTDSSGIDGVVVLKVQPESPAGKAGILPNDIITSIDETDIKNSYQARTSISKAYKKDSFIIMLRRNDATLTKKLYIPPKPRTTDL